MADPHETIDVQKASDVSGSSVGRIPAPIRHQRIRDAFQKQGFVSVTDIAQEIGVSAMTIRRDLGILEREGMIVRTHGGAMASAEADKAVFDTEEPVFDQRRAKNADAKVLIARTAAALVGPRESIGLDVGTSTLALASELAGRSDLRIFTNNMRAAMELAGRGSPIYILGGEVRVPEFSVVGSGAVQSVRNHFLDRVFIGVSGIGEQGLYDFSPEDTEVKRAFIESAGSIVVLCDSSKFGRRALARIVGLDAVDILITDAEPPPALAEALRGAGVQVLIAGAKL